MPRLFVTGFGSFGDFDENPSAWLAERLGHPYRVLEVSFEAVERFLTHLRSEPFDAYLALGVNGGARDLHLEWIARNWVGAAPDVRDVVRPGKIAPHGPDTLASNLWTDLATLPSRSRHSVDAGSYLCNYLLYRALQEFPDRRVGFLHVPPFSRLRATIQLRRVSELVEGVSAVAS